MTSQEVQHLKQAAPWGGQVVMRGSCLFDGGREVQQVWPVEGAGMERMQLLGKTISQGALPDQAAHARGLRLFQQRLQSADKHVPLQVCWPSCTHAVLDAFSHTCHVHNWSSEKARVVLVVGLPPTSHNMS